MRLIDLLARSILFKLNSRHDVLEKQLQMLVCMNPAEMNHFGKIGYSFEAFEFQVSKETAEKVADYGYQCTFSDKNSKLQSE
jgi:hypothetical protein